MASASSTTSRAAASSTRTTSATSPPRRSTCSPPRRSSAGPCIGSASAAWKARTRSVGGRSRKTFPPSRKSSPP